MFGPNTPSMSHHIMNMWHLMSWPFLETFLYSKKTHKEWENSLIILHLYENPTFSLKYYNILLPKETGSTSSRFKTDQKQLMKLEGQVWRVGWKVVTSFSWQRLSTLPNTNDYDQLNIDKDTLQESIRILGRMEKAL